ncbi:MAG TPA: pitrilysin family protein [Polyangia bacterium]|nr:pitrilysin family protein [Polyangia bacterium]
MKAASFVCAALGVGPLLLGCRAPQGPGVPVLAAAAMPVVVDGRQTREVLTLGNGVRVIVEENHVTPVVALQVWVAAGSAAEPAGQGGIAHLTERAVLDGATPNDAGVDVAPLSAWTSLDETVFQTVVAAPFAAARLADLGAMLARPAADGAVEGARLAVVAERARAASSPAAVANEALFAATFGAHAYGRPTSGAEASVKALTAADVAAFRARAYVGANVTVVIVGDFDARALCARATQAFADVPRGGALDAPRAPALVAGPVVTVVDGAESRLAIGFRMPGLADVDLAAVDLLAATLARGQGGRLPGELVANRQLARAATASVVSARAAGLLTLDVPLVSGRAEEAARVVLGETARLAHEELAPEELEATRAALEADVVRGDETAAGYARRLGFFATVARDEGRGDRYLARLHALTSSSVREVAARLFDASNVSLVALTPAGARGAPEAIAERLRDVARGDARLASPSPPAAVSAIGNVVRVVLPSGLRVLVLRDPTVPTVAAEALWSGGVRLEDARTNGVTGLLAATLTRGTRTRDAARLRADAAAIGGALAAIAGRDELGVEAQFLARGWERGLELLADCVRHPAFPEEEVERARRDALERVRAHEDDVDEEAARLFAATLWSGHPYRLPVFGTASSIAGLTRRRLADHFQRYYGAANLTIAVVGDVDARRVVAELQALFADARPPLAPPPPTSSPAPSPSDAPTEVFALAPRDEAHVVVGYAGLALREPDRRAADVLARILGGPTGRLASELGGSSLADATAWSGVEGGALAFDLASTPDALDAAVASLRAALARVLAAGFTTPEVDRARAALVGADARGLEDRAAVAFALARDEAFGLGVGAYRRAPAELAAVTTDAVMRVARRLLDPRREIVAVVRPPAAPVVTKTALAAKVAKTPTRLPTKATPKPGPGGARPAAP